MASVVLECGENAELVLRAIKRIIAINPAALVEAERQWQSAVTDTVGEAEILAKYTRNGVVASLVTAPHNCEFEDVQKEDLVPRYDWPGPGA